MCGLSVKLEFCRPLSNDAETSFVTSRWKISIFKGIVALLEKKTKKKDNFGNKLW